MGVAEIDVVCREAGDCFAEGDGDGDQSVIAARAGVGGTGDGGAGRLVVAGVGAGGGFCWKGGGAGGGGRVLQRPHARRYRQVSRREAGLIQLLGEDKGDGAYLVGAGQVGVADRRGARESGRPGVDDEGGAGGVVGGAGRVVADGALGSVQIRSRREGALIDPGGGGAEGLDV